MNLYEIEVTAKFYMLAEDRADARKRAESCYRDACRDGGAEPEFFTGEAIVDVANVDRDWHDALPYGNTGEEKTIAQMFADGEIGT